MGEKETNKCTQKALNQIFSKKVRRLDIDGVVGILTILQLSMLDTMLVEYFKKNGYILHEKNLIGIRMKNSYTNRFSDLLVCFTPNKKEAIKILPMSTSPGLYGVGNVLNPKTIVTATFPKGYKGVAVMKEGNYKDLYQLVDNPFGWTGTEYMQQVGKVNIFRDGNSDFRIDRNVEESGWFGINFHTWRGFWRDSVNNLSQGCQVLKHKHFKAALPFLRELTMLKTQKRLIDYTLINIKDLK